MLPLLLLLFPSDPEQGAKLSGGFGSVALVKIASFWGFREFLEDLRRNKLSEPVHPYSVEQSTVNS